MIKIESINRTDLKPAEYNPRQISKHDYAKLKEGLIKFGFVDPVIVNKNKDRLNIVIGGHQRLKVAEDLKIETIPVVYVDLNEKDERELNLRLNRNNGEWDYDVLANLFEIEELLDAGFLEQELLGAKILDPLETSGDDDIPEQAEKMTVPGDLWELGEHRLYCGDSTLIDDIHKVMNGVKAQIAITDPPYGVSYADKNKFLNTIDKGNRNQNKIENDHLNEDDIKVLWKTVFSNMALILDDKNSYYIFGPQIHGMMMMMMMMIEAGLPYKHVLIWVKNNHVLGRSDYHYKHEPIFFGWTKTHKFYGEGEFNTSVWPVDKPLKNDLHPTMKPVKLMQEMLLNSSQKGDVCFEPFCGSGSTLIACESLQRKCYSIEKEPKYCDVIVRRYVDFCKKNSIPYTVKLNGEKKEL